MWTLNKKFYNLSSAYSEKSNRFINRKIKLNSNLIRRIRSSWGRVHDLNMICINWIKFENSCFVHFYLSNHAPNSKPIRKEGCTWIQTVKGPWFIKLVLMISKSRDVFLIRTSCIEMDVDSKCWKIRGVPKIWKRPKFQNFRQNWLGLESAGNWGWILRNRKRGKTKIRLEIHAVMDLNYTMSIHFRIIINQTADLYPSEIQKCSRPREF